MLLNLAEEAGMKYIVPFMKHHTGFCLWPSSYTKRNVYDMCGGKDFAKPLVEGCKKRGLKFGFYFSLNEWGYPVIQEDGTIANNDWSEVKPYTPDMEYMQSGKIAVKEFGKHYALPQAVEFIDRYDPDLIWYDGDWRAKHTFYKSYDIAAYYYNQAEGRKEVAVSDRYGVAENGKWLRFVRGDFFCSEYDNMKHLINSHPWEECRGISQSFGFNWQDTDENVISSKQFIDMFVDIVSKGGNLLLIVNLDAQGALPEIQEKRLKDVGQWLKVNGEGIYSTRAYSTTAEGNIRYTRSKDNKMVYAISLQWPGKTLQLLSVKPAEHSEIYMLGYDKPLKWSYTDGVTTVSIPQSLQKESKRPCGHAYTFRIEQ